MLRLLKTSSLFRRPLATVWGGANPVAPQPRGNSATRSTFAQQLRCSSTGGSKDYYKTLGISRGADVKEIKKAYRKRALETHPDQGGNKEEFAEVAEAYEVLSNPEKKQIYDQYGSEAASNPNMGFGGGFGSGRSAEDIFADFFRSAGGFGDMFGGGRQAGPQKVESLQVRLRVSLEDVYKGTTKTIRVTRPQVCTECTGFGTKSKTEKAKCAQCHGQGHVAKQHRMGPGMIQQTIAECPRCRGTGTVAKPEDQCNKCHGKGYRNVAEDVSLDIPAGFPANATLLVNGEGGTIPNAQPGDLLVHLEVNPHRVFQRRGDDLLVQKEVTLSEALLGLHFPLKLLDGRTINVQTSADVVLKPDGVVKLAGEGMPSINGSRGDIFIYTHLKMPSRLTQEQRDGITKALGEPAKDTDASPGNTVKGRIMRETREQLEEQKRGVWAAQEDGGRVGQGGRGSRAMGGGERQAECTAQ